MVGFCSAARPALLVTTLALALTALALAGCGDDLNAPELEGANLLELTADADDLQLLRELIAEVALSGTLRTGSDLTFFAPTDEALLRLGPDMLGRLRLPGNEPILDKLIRRHVVRGRFRLGDLRDGMTLEPLAGPPLSVTVDGDEVSIGGVDGGAGGRLSVRARLDDDDFPTGNGVLHRIDAVVRDHLTLAERLRVTPIVRTFADALDTAQITDEVTGDGPFTLFIPINTAFAAFTPFEIQSLLSFANRGVLLKVLRHHAVPGRVRLDDLTTGTTLTALDGSALEVVTEDGVTSVDGARVIVPEIGTSDGLIYLLDAVVLEHLDLSERLQIAPEFFTSSSILRDAGVLGNVDDGGDYTVFAAPDDSWDALGLSFLPELRDRPDLLLRTAQYSVIAGRVEPEDLLIGDDLTTLGDYTLPITVRQDIGGPQVFIAGRTQVELSPREASNGLIYTVESFFTPPDLNLEERAVFTALYRFLNIAESADQTALLTGEEEYTIFGPTDAALAGVSIPGSEAGAVFRGHVVAGRFRLRDLSSGQQLTTLLGTTIEITIIPPPSNQAGLYVDGFRVRDFIGGTATNGEVYAVEGVLTLR